MAWTVMTDEQIVDSINVIAGAMPVTCGPEAAEVTISAMIQELGMRGFARSSIEEVVSGAVGLLNTRWADYAKAKAAPVVDLAALKAAEDLRVRRIVARR